MRMENLSFVKTPAQVIESEGKLISVEEFEMSLYPVTVGQYSEFAKTTGYQTHWERVGRYESFRRNDALAGVPKDEKKLIPAMYLNWYDLEAFCSWINCALPSQEQWLSSRIKERLFSSFDEAIRLPYAYSMEEFTSHTEGDLVQLRSGPPRYLYEGWMKDSYYSQRLIPKTEGGMSIGFRIIRK